MKHKTQNVEDCRSTERERASSKAFPKRTHLHFDQSAEHALYGSKMACFCSSFSCISHSWSRACHIDIHCSTNCITQSQGSNFLAMGPRHDSPVKVTMLSPPVPRWLTSSACDFNRPDHLKYIETAEDLPGIGHFSFSHFLRKTRTGGVRLVWLNALFQTISHETGWNSEMDSQSASFRHQNSPTSSLRFWASCSWHSCIFWCIVLDQAS